MGGEKHSRMRWPWGLSLFLAVLAVVTAQPLDQAPALESQYITELLHNLLIPSEREGRQIQDEQDEEEAEEVAEVEAAEGEGEALEDSEALKEAKKVEVSRFNNYIDAIYRRMNAALKAKLMDPMELNLDEKAKKNEGKKGKSEKTRVLREAIGEDDDENDVDRMGKPAKTEKKAGKGMKGMSKEERLAEKKKRKLRRQKKNDAKEKKEKKSDAKEKKKEMKEKKMERMERKAKKSKEPKEKKMEAKRKRKNKDARESRSNRRNKDKKKGQNKNKNKARNNNKKKSNEKKARRGNDGKEEKMVGALSGIATMLRSGDVTVVDEETHKVVTSDFSVGPLQLQVSKIYGRGKARTVKTAMAITDVMSGTLVLKVKPDGTAHVKKVVFKKPENVEVKGKLSENDPRSLNYLRNSVNKMRPLAALKVLKTARYVLKSPNSN